MKFLEITIFFINLQFLYIARIIAKQVIRILISLLICSLTLVAYSQENENLEFIANKGQWSKEILYKTKLMGGDLWLESNTLTFNYQSEKDLETYHQIHHGEISYDSAIHYFHMHSMQMQFLHSSINVKANPSKENENYYNYFLGNDSAMWASKVPSFKKVELENIYDGIDLLLNTENRQLHYDLKISPNFDPATIQIQFNGAKAKLINNELHFELSVGEIIHSAPKAFQFINNRKVDVKCNYLLKDDILSFDLPDGYDENYELIIDPELIFSTYSGSTADNFGFSATYDEEGNLYAGGIAFDFGYPVTIGAYQTSFEEAVDISITKFNEIGTDLLYSTYIGGNWNEFPQSMMVDYNDNLCIYGSTNSSNFPTTWNVFQSQNNSSTDIIVCKLSPNGDQLLASTYIGGTSPDGGMTYVGQNHLLTFNYADAYRGEIFVDLDNTIYIASYTYSNDFPCTENAEKDTIGGLMDGIVIHISENLSELLFSSYIGGSDLDVLNSIRKKDDLIIVGGGTKSIDFPSTNGALNESITGTISSGVVLRIDENGGILNSTYLGEGDMSMVYMVDIGPESNIYAQGFCSGNYPVSENVYSSPFSQQFIQEMDQSLTTSVQSTIFGSSDSIYNHFSSTAFMVDDCGLIYIAGYVALPSSIESDPNFPVTSNAFQDSTDGRDFYFIVFNRDFQSLLIASYFGEYGVSEHVDGGTSRFRKDGTIFHAVCASCGGTSAFPTTPGVWSETNGSSQCNLAAFKVFMEAQVVDANFFVHDTLVCGGSSPFEIQFEHQGRAAPYYFWDFGDGQVSNLQDPINYYETPGSYTVQHIVIDSTTCISYDTAYATFNISFVEDFIMDWDVSSPLYCKDTLYVALEFIGQSADSLIWDMGDGTIYYQNPVFYQYDEAGNYEVSLQAFNFECGNEGFLNTEFLLEENLISSKVAVPNIFSPNGDGRNDYFQLYYLSKPNDDPLFYIEELSMKIYNRWGRLVYKSDSNPNSWRWDGRSDNIEVSEGVYYYIIEYSSLCEGGGIEKFAGDVTLVRQRRR